MGEKELMLKIKEGDGGALAIFHELTRDRVYAYCFKMTRSKIIANELVQETYIAIWKQRSYLDKVSFPIAYTMRIASRAVYKYLANKKPIEQIDERHHENKFQYRQISAHDQVETKEILTVIHKAVNLLPLRQQQVFKLNKYEGLSYKEIASELCLSVSTVSNYLEIAMNKVRSYITKNNIQYD